MLLKRLKLLWERYKLFNELEAKGFVYTINPPPISPCVSYDRDGVSVFVVISRNPMKQLQLWITIIDFEIVERNGVYDYRVFFNEFTDTATETIKFIETSLLTRSFEML